MAKIELIPLKGISIEQIGTIAFGMTSDEVKKILGKPDQGNEKELFYYSSELRLGFDPQNGLEFIEIISGPYPEDIEPLLYDIDPFAMPAKELVGLLAQKNGSDIDDDEAPYCYLYRNISVGVFREFTDEDIQQDIDEAKEAGTYDDEKESFLEDMKVGKHFWTIGIGNEGCYE